MSEFEGKARSYPMPFPADRYSGQLGRGGRIRFVEEDERKDRSAEEVFSGAVRRVAIGMLNTPGSNPQDVVFRKGMCCEATQRIGREALSVIGSFERTGEFINDRSSEVGMGCSVLLRCSSDDMKVHSDIAHLFDVVDGKTDDVECVFRGDFPDGSFDEVEGGVKVSFRRGRDGRPTKEVLFRDGMFVRAEGHVGGVTHRKEF
ncbi:MAG: hypothetical protein V1679_01965, partial [Candidatus Peregrinibacteria bacterium]